MKHRPAEREAAASVISQCEARRRKRPSGTRAYLGKHVVCVCVCIPLLEVMPSSSSEANLHGELKHFNHRHLRV